MSHQLTPIGVLPHFPGLEQCYRSENGFIVSEKLGGANVIADLDREFDAREDDIWVVSFPKTGTTWMQEIVYLLGTNLDYETAKNQRQVKRFPYLEIQKLGIANIKNLQPPRYLKSHYPYSLLPPSVIAKKCKMIYTIRNPKDTLVSYYYFSIMNKYIDFDSDFPKYFELFVTDQISYGPYWKHILEFWERRHEENILIVSYEEMKKDSIGVIKRVASFLGKSYTDAEIEGISSHCSYSEMKKNPSTNIGLHADAQGVLNDSISPFMRKGEVGDWKNYLTDEMNQQMDKYTQEHFSGTGLEFEYE